MDRQYTIINQCLQLLKQSDLPAIKKLRVEIQFIQMKRLLLNETREIRYGSYGDEVFEGLLSQMKRISVGGAGYGESDATSDATSDAVSELMEQLRGMLTVLGGEQALH